MNQLLNLVGGLLIDDGWLGTLLKIAIVLGAIIGLGVPGMVYFERKICAWMQGRQGPNRVGPFGILQVLADGIKLIFKEDVVPAKAIRPFFILGPVFAFVPTMMAMAVIPFGAFTNAHGELVSMKIADLNVGVVYLLSVASLNVYGILIGGWASSNKYTLMGGLRSSAQTISYEIPLALSVLGVIMLTGSPRLGDIVAAQQEVWFIFPACVGCLVFLVSIFAETNRLPFDLPEGETEIIGFHIEYSSMKFATYFLVEYAHMISASALFALFFLGGWELLPWFSWQALGEKIGADFYGTLWFIPSIWFVGKIAAMLFFFIWIRWTLPRFRYDQLMNLGWKRLLPIALVNLLILVIVILFKEGVL